MGNCIEDDLIRLLQLHTLFGVVRITDDIVSSQVFMMMNEYGHERVWFSLVVPINASSGKSTLLDSCSAAEDERSLRLSESESESHSGTDVSEPLLKLPSALVTTVASLNVLRALSTSTSGSVADALSTSTSMLGALFRGLLLEPLPSVMGAL